MTSITSEGLVEAAISAADLLAAFLKLTLTMILSPEKSLEVLQFS